jgi:hypothetical protein
VQKEKKTGSLAISTVSVPPGDRGTRYALFGSVSLAIAAATIENGLHPLALLVLPIVYLALLRHDYRASFLWSETVGSVLFFLYVPAFFLATLAFRASVTLPFFIVYFTFGILMVRVLSPLTDRNIWQVIFLSIGLILVNCILTNHLLFGLLLPIYLFSLMAALLCFHLARSRALSRQLIESSDLGLSPRTWYARLAKYSLLVLACTVVAFIVLPRPFLAIPGLAAGMAKMGGFSDLEQQIRYRDMAGMTGNQRIAFKVILEKGKLPESPYWRGRVLDRTDGSAWYAGSQLRGMGRLIKPGKAEPVVYQIIPFRLQSKIVYAHGLPISAVGRGRRPLYVTSNAEVVIDSPFLAADLYELSTVDLPIPFSSKKDSLNLRQDGVTPRIADLAKQWTAQYASPREKAMALTSRLRSRFKYVLENPVPPENAHPIEHFLFETRAGNCEYFAGTLALMLRSLGIPARVVEGFAGVEKTDRPNEFLVRFSRAHAWAEASLDGATWLTLDATPARRDLAGEHLWRIVTDVYDQLEYNWIKYVVYFDRSDQAQLLSGLNQLLKGELPVQFSPRSNLVAYGVVVTVVAVFLIATLFVARRFFLRPRDLTAIYTSTMTKLVQHGALTRLHGWHERNATEIERRAPALKAPLTGFMDLYFRARFGGDASVSAAMLQDAGKHLVKSAKTFEAGSPGN